MKRAGDITKAEESLLEEDELFRYYWPNDHFFSTTKVKRYDQPPDDRRDNEERATDEWDLELPEKRLRCEEYLYKSMREIEREERKVNACHDKWNRADMSGRSDSDEEVFSELEGRHSPIEESFTGLRKMRAVKEDLL